MSDMILSQNAKKHKTKQTKANKQNFTSNPINTSKKHIDIIMKTFVTTYAFSAFLAMSVSADTSIHALRGSEEIPSTDLSLEHPPNDFDDRHDNRNLEVSKEEVSKLLVTSIAKQIPFGGFVADAIDILWNTEDISEFWDAILEEVQEMIDAAILAYDIGELQDAIQSCSRMMEYVDDANWETDGSTKYTQLLSANNKAYDIYLDLRMATSSEESGGWDFTDGDYTNDVLKENMLMIDLAAIFAPMHLSILKDLCLYSVSYNDVSVTLAESYCEELDDYAKKYQEYFEHMKDIFYDWRYAQFDIVNKGKTGGTFSSCYGEWTVEDTLDELPYESHSRSCYKDWCGSSYRSSGIDDCIDGKIEDYMAEVMPDLVATFDAIVDPMLTIESDATNRPEIITCSPVEIAAWNYDTNDWDCFEQGSCLTDGVDGSCEDDEVCSEHSDCQSNFCTDYNYCYSVDTTDISKRRRLEAMPGHILSNDDWEEYKEICSHVEYTLSLAVDSHMQFLAEPIYYTSESNIEGNRCPSILFHRGSVEKEVLVLNEHYSAEHWGVAEVGVYKLQKLAEAHDGVELSTEYDVVLDNCGDYVVQYALNLGVHTTSDMAVWVATELVKHTNGDLSEQILANKNMEVYGITNEMSDVEIVLRVVEGRAMKLYGDDLLI